MSNIRSPKNVRRGSSSIQFLIAKDLEDILTNEENTKVGESLKQIKSRNYVDLTTPQEILKHFRKCLQVETERDRRDSNSQPPR